MADVELAPEGIIIRRWLRRRLLPWSHLERIELRDQRHTERRHPRFEVIRRGGGFWLRGRSDPGEVWYGEVSAMLKSGRRVKLRHSCSQFRGEDLALKEWAEQIRAKLAESS